MAKISKEEAVGFVYLGVIISILGFIFDCSENRMNFLFMGVFCAAAIILYKKTNSPKSPSKEKFPPKVPPKQAQPIQKKQETPPPRKEERKTDSYRNFDSKIDIDNELIQEYLDEFSKRNFEIIERVDDREIRATFNNGLLNECVIEIMKKMGLVENKVELKIYNDIEFPSAGKDCAAFVSIPSNLPLYGSKAFNNLFIPISIKSSYTKKYEAFVYAIAHELAHIVLHSIRNTLKESEMSTDLFVMLKGFVLIMESGRKIIDQQGNTTNLGYLKQSSFEFAKKYLKDLRVNKSDMLGHWGNYKSVEAGSQVWMAENLKVRYYSNGAPIPEAHSHNEWLSYCSQGIGCLCEYEFDSSNGKKFGLLYNWYVIVDNRGLLKQGWHIPQKEEFEVLIDYWGGKNSTAKKMKELNTEDAWAALAGGFCGQNGLFNSINLFCGWWSCTESIDGNAWVCGLYYNNNNVNLNDYNKTCGFSIRCVKDSNNDFEKKVNFILVKS